MYAHVFFFSRYSPLINYVTLLKPFVILPLIQKKFMKQLNL